jgi:hypothetical protein
MQYDQQEMRYGPNSNSNASQRVEYLNPIKICEEQHTFRIEDLHEDLQGLRGEEREKKIANRTKEFEARYALYLGHAMLQFQHWESMHSRPLQLWVSVSLHISN